MLPTRMASFRHIGAVGRPIWKGNFLRPYLRIPRESSLSKVRFSTSSSSSGSLPPTIESLKGSLRTQKKKDAVGESRDASAGIQNRQLKAMKKGTSNELTHLSKSLRMSDRFEDSLRLNMDKKKVNIQPKAFVVKKKKYKNLVINEPTKKEKMNAYWLLGLVDGKGRFDVIVPPDAQKLGDINLRFSIVVNLADGQLLEKCRKFFGVGRIIQNREEGFSTYTVTKLNNIESEILPFFEKYKLVSRKKILWMRFRRTFMWIWRHKRGHSSLHTRYLKKIRHLISCKSGLEDGYDKGETYGNMEDVGLGAIDDEYEYEEDDEDEDEYEDEYKDEESVACADDEVDSEESHMKNKTKQTSKYGSF